MDTLVDLGKRLAQVRKKSICRKDIQVVTTLDGEVSCSFFFGILTNQIGQMIGEHSRLRQIRDRSLQELNVATSLEKVSSEPFLSDF
jgi:hypothetical protein